MKERVLDAIYNKLEDNPEDENLQRQITLLNKACICTIDSFCLDVIKNNFYETDISPNFRIADTAEINLLKQDVLEELFENKYEGKDENFVKLITTYTSYRDDSPLKELILKIYEYMQSNPFPENWITEKIEMFNLKDKLNRDFSQTIWGETLLNDIEEELIDDILILQKEQTQLAKEPELDKFKRVIEDDIEKLQMLKLNLDSWNKAYEIAINLKFKTWPIDKKVIFEEKEIAKKARDNVKKKLKKKIDKILIFNSKEANQDIYDMYEKLYLLKNLILEFKYQFEKEKRKKNILDFNDIEHLALKILLTKDKDGNYKPSEVAKMYQERFDEIAIDEYQDSNLVQESILTAIQKNNNIFMVGDVKQSIYRFRQARPELFLDKYAKYKLKKDKKENDNLKIQLFKNFRSRQNVLDFTNLIFENIMSNLLGDIDYNEDEFLNLGANYRKYKEQNYKTEIKIIDVKDKESQETEINELQEKEQVIENTEIEAKAVAKQIKQIIDSKQKIFDTKKGEFRDVEYKDIVILLRSTKDTAPVFEKEILNQKMPVFSDTSAEYFDSIEIQTIMSILQIIDNPLNDIALVTCLRSPIGGFTDNDLVQIRLSDKYDDFYTAMIKAKLNVKEELKNKIEEFLNNIEKWRQEQEYLGLDELIWKIYTDTCYYNYVGLMPNGELRQANLKKLFEKAKQYESASFKGLFNFINFIEKLRQSSGDFGAAKLIGENENVIRIMSIHKSKGLEFPIVFLCGTGKQFNLMDLNNSILMHHDMGFGVKYIDYEQQIEYDTLSKSAIRNKLLQETLSEEMRILYVALTRAKEKLFVYAISKDIKQEITKMREISEMYPKTFNIINPIVIKKCKRYIDWILLVSLYNQKSFNDMAEFSIIDKNEIINVEEEQEENVDIIGMLEKIETDNEGVKQIAEILEYKYPYGIATTLPTKTSVTSLKQMKYDSKDNIIPLEQLQDNDEIVSEEISFELPKFLSNDKDRVITSAQKGTLIHLCLQRLDFRKNYTLEDVNSLIQELQTKKIITEIEAKAINSYKIYQFTKSKIWEEAKYAKEIYQEKPFYINIPAKDVINEDVDETILVQGIIDLFFVDKDDNLVLVDYKTDFVETGKESELINKYANQIKLYSDALERALHKKVYKKYIYSVFLGKELEMN